MIHQQLDEKKKQPKASEWQDFLITLYDNYMIISRYFPVTCSYCYFKLFQAAAGVVFPGNFIGSFILDTFRLLSDTVTLGYCVVTFRYFRLRRATVW